MHIRVVSASSPVARFPTRGICPSHEPLLALQARSHALQFDLGHYPLEKPVEEAGQVSNCALMVKKKKRTRTRLRAIISIFFVFISLGLICVPW